MDEPILKLSNSQARELAGRPWTINGRTYRFVSFDPSSPGQPPWKTGAEGRAFPLRDSTERIALYAKFFKSKSRKRFDRTVWLTRRNIHHLGRGLKAAPMLWADSRSIGRPEAVDFDITACCAQAVPGETWKELKYRIHSQSAVFPDALRWRCVEDLLAAAAALEENKVIHGDLSDNNVIIDLQAPAHRPALYLIDFDAFVALDVPHLTLSLEEGGTYGTEGYHPPDLAKCVAAGDRSAAPYSDRYGRDMLLLELLLFSARFSPDEAPAGWSLDSHRRKLFDAAMARCPQGLLKAIEHLQASTVFRLSESERPSSVQLLGRSASHVAVPAPRRVRPHAHQRPPVAVKTPRVTTTAPSRVRPPLGRPAPTPVGAPVKKRKHVAYAALLLVVLAFVVYYAVRPGPSRPPARPPVQESLAPGSPEAQERQRQAVQTLALPLEVKAARTGIVFRLIPTGTFTRGSPSSEAQRDNDETSHQVTLTKPFYCGKFEVTQGQWQQVMGNNPSHFKSTGADAPVETVSWEDCQAFLKRLCQMEGVAEGTYRLLTEAEWEYACRAGTQTPFAYGNDLDSTMANFDGNYPYGSGRKGQYRQTTVAVGSFRPNAWGLYDMHGNVYEWCQDWYGTYPSGSVTDALGPRSGGFRVFRGGGWHGSAGYCRSANRYGSTPGGRYQNLGLRLARTTPSYP